MAQAGIHAFVGMATRKWMPQKEWLVLGLVLGNISPDLDNLVVAYATLAKLPDPEGFHRTFSHSILTIAIVLVAFYLISFATRSEKWKNFGNGFGIGILMHILADLVLWFNGVELMWPIRYELNFWDWFVTPGWLKILLDTGEFLALGLYFLFLFSLARRQNTDVDRRRSLTVWAYMQFALFVLFALIFFILGTKGMYYTVYGGLYLVSLLIAIVITIRLRRTLEAT